MNHFESNVDVPSLQSTFIAEPTFVAKVVRFWTNRRGLFFGCCIQILTNASTWLAISTMAFVGRVIAQQTDTPLPAIEAAQSMIVPEGFRVTLFAAEPDVKQPIGFCIDDRGRLWVAEAYNYPNHGTKPGDRIVILEDTDHDGRFDKRTMFYDQLNYVTGIEVGFGGAWVMSPPYFYFIPDRDGNDVPDAEPQVLLDGFGNHANAHNLANGFAWGPDGWLYGTHGRTNWSRIGKPGSPDEQRVQFDGGVYRYHPVRHVWEAYADGTTNPWGIDWDDFGEAFVCNCVNPHLFHVIPGAHYEPWRNRESSRYAYQRIDTIADHLHFVGTDNVREGLGSTEEDAVGGGHAHCGTMVYLGDNWPAKYRNSVFMNNIHGKRINQDFLTRAGSGYSASHAPDLMRSRDPWHVGVTLQYGPDGGVFVLDWSDTGECHHTRNTQRETGRVYKIVYDQPTPMSTDLSKRTNRELVELQLHRNDWHVRHARRILQERASQGEDMKNERSELLAQCRENSDVTRKLRAIWALWSIGGVDEAFWKDQLKHSDEHVRTWAIRLLCEKYPEHPTDELVLQRFVELAETDPSSRVRLYLASVLQRLPNASRWEIARALLQRAEDDADQNIPLMIWYAVEPLSEVDIDRFIRLAGDSKIRLVVNHIARRVASSKKASDAMPRLIESLMLRKEPEFQWSIVDGILRGLEGIRSMKMPPNWARAFELLQSSSNADLRQSTMALALIFDDPNAIARLKQQAENADLPTSAREQALQSLIAKKAHATPDLLIGSLQSTPLRRLSIRGLAEFDHPETAAKLLALYPSSDTGTQQDILQTLASRPKWAHALLDAMESNTIARRDVTAFTARQLLSLDDSNVQTRLVSIWGELRSTPDEISKKLTSLKKQLTASAIKKADLAMGRGVFQKSCSSCHRLFDAGGTIGPDITGSQRTNLDYLLENMLDPSASVAKDFQMELLLLEGGRTVSGLIVDESENAVTVQTVNERLVVPKKEIDTRKLSKVSLMPDGLLNSLSKEEVVALVAYLANPVQVPLAPHERPQ
jgi:putative membrane-bound dehydrogenase-like protein